MYHKKKLWFDFTNPPHVNLLTPLIEEFSIKYKIHCTAREFVETTKLLEKNKITFSLIGRHGGQNILNKIIEMVKRDVKLLSKLPKFDVSISSNHEAPQVSWIRRKKSIIFEDNDTSPNWLYAPFVTKVISPVYINKSKMKHFGISDKKLITYEGFKEDIYLADFEPDPNFLNYLPFKEFVTVRPENIQASYVEGKTVSIVPELLKKLVYKGYNVLFLPRYDLDREYAIPSPKVYTPHEPLSGLDVCYYSSVVLTGAGTFAREAALLGTPAVSFYMGKEILSVDKHLITEKKIFHSRNVDEIFSYLRSVQKHLINNERSRQVKYQVIDILRNLIE